MLTAEAAGLALTIAKGLVRLTKRVDLVLAEKVAAEAPLPLPVPDLSLSPTQPQMRTGLRQLLDQPVAGGNDPISADRAEIEELLANHPTSSQMYSFVKKYLPELAARRILDLNGSFMLGVAPNTAGLDCGSGTRGGGVLCQFGNRFSQQELHLAAGADGCGRIGRVRCGEHSPVLA